MQSLKLASPRSNGYIDRLNFNLQRLDTNEGFRFGLNVDDNLDIVTRVCKSDLSFF